MLTAPGAPFEVARGDGGRLEYVGGPRTLREFVEVTWAFGDQVFLLGEDGTAYTYREFFAAACGLARRLTDEFGLRPGDRAVVAGRNHPEWQIAFWATQLAGLVAVPLNAWWTADECAYALDDCDPKVLLVDDERVRTVQEWARRRGVPWVDFRDMCAGDPLVAPPSVELSPDDDATILYTSGTTGRPKGAVATHRAQVGAALNPRYQAAAAALERGGVPGQGRPPVSLTTFPFFHAAAFTSVYGVMAAGGTLVLMRKWDAAKALELVERHRVTHYAGVPATALQLLDAAGGKGLDSLTNFNTGGASAPAEIVRRLTEAYGDRIEPRNGYGLTETCGGVLAQYGDAYRRRPDSVGRPTPVTEVRVAGPDGRALPDGEVGELLLRGQSLVRGYWRDERATAEAFTADGWFRTGDLAVVREDGRVSVVDRIKDVVVRGGENVYCAEVEAALHAHPAVADAAVLGVPHPVLGEEVAAVVRLRGRDAGCAAADDPRDELRHDPRDELRRRLPDELRRELRHDPRDELRAYVGRSLAAFKVPAHVLVHDGPLPRNAAGKVLKDELRTRVADVLSGG